MNDMTSYRTIGKFGSAVSLAAAFLLCVLSSTSQAGIAAGPRAGVSRTPDQVVIGGQATLGAVFPFVQLSPSVDFGFGNKTSITTFNVDFRLDLPGLPGFGPKLYLGAGPALILVTPEGEDRKTDFGFSAIAGLKIPAGPFFHYNLEARMGIGNAPDVKVLFGVLWGL